MIQYSLNEILEIFENSVMRKYFCELYVQPKNQSKFKSYGANIPIKEIERLTEYNVKIKMIDDDIDISNYIRLARDIVIENVKCISGKPYNETWEHFEYEKIKAIKWFKDTANNIYGVNGNYVLENLYKQGYLKGYEHIIPNIVKHCSTGFKKAK